MDAAGHPETPRLALYAIPHYGNYGADPAIYFDVPPVWCTNYFGMDCTKFREWNTAFFLLQTESQMEGLGQVESIGSTCSFNSWYCFAGATPAGFMRTVAIEDFPQMFYPTGEPVPYTGQAYDLDWTRVQPTDPLSSSALAAEIRTRFHTHAAMERWMAHDYDAVSFPEDPLEDWIVPNCGLMTATACTTAVEDEAQSVGASSPTITTVTVSYDDADLTKPAGAIVGILPRAGITGLRTPGSSGESESRGRRQRIFDAHERNRLKSRNTVRAPARAGVGSVLGRVA